MFTLEKLPKHMHFFQGFVKDKLKNSRRQQLKCKIVHEVSNSRFLSTISFDVLGEISGHKYLKRNLSLPVRKIEIDKFI
jgi:hypothetical protein